MTAWTYYTGWGRKKGEVGAVHPVSVHRHQSTELQTWSDGKWITVPWPNTPLNEDTMFDRTPEVEALGLANSL